MFAMKEERKPVQHLVSSSIEFHGNSAVVDQSMVNLSLFLQRNLGNCYLQSTVGSRQTLGLANGQHGIAAVQGKCDCGNHTMGGGECQECRKTKRFGLQTKLNVNEPGDIYEQEADRIADQVIAAPAHPGVSGAPPGIQRLAGQSTGQADTAPASVEQALASPGRPLEPALRQDMEQRFGHDFSRVRVHTDAKAADSARVLNSVAYTVGEDVVFGAGHYAPQADKGRHLLAHELTHVVQQRGGGVLRIQRSLAGCRDLLSDPNVASLISGSLVHRIIAAHFRQTVAGARSVAIPGASAGPLRSEGLCGGPKPVIDPQVVGGMSGAGFPDLARITTGRILQVAEIKPAAVPCLVDGEEQALRYIDQGNARDAAQTAWRASLGVTVVSPMLESAYMPPSFRVTAPGVANAELRTAWCTPGLLAYTVKVLGQPVRVTAPQRQRAEARDRLRQEAISSGASVAVGVGAATVAAVAGRALWRHFWRVVIQRFAIRGAIALGLSAADGPLPFGELISLGIAAVTVIQIISDWDDLWREADRTAVEGTYKPEQDAGKNKPENRLRAE